VNEGGTLGSYPEFVSPNILVRALFNPNVKYQGLIQVQSELTRHMLFPRSSALTVPPLRCFLIPPSFRHATMEILLA
jgi:hypothetical protein